MQCAYDFAANKTSTVVSQSQLWSTEKKQPENEMCKPFAGMFKTKTDFN